MRLRRNGASLVPSQSLIQRIPISLNRRNFALRRNTTDTSTRQARLTANYQRNAATLRRTGRNSRQDEPVISADFNITNPLTRHCPVVNNNVSTQRRGVIAQSSTVSWRRPSLLQRQRAYLTASHSLSRRPFPSGRQISTSRVIGLNHPQRNSDVRPFHTVHRSTSLNLQNRNRNVSRYRFLGTSVPPSDLNHSCRIRHLPPVRTEARNNSHHSALGSNIPNWNSRPHLPRHICANRNWPPLEHRLRRTVNGEHSCSAIQAPRGRLTTLPPNIASGNARNLNAINVSFAQENEFKWCTKVCCLEYLSLVTSFRCILMFVGALGVLCLVSGIILGSLHLSGPTANYMSTSMLFIAPGILMLIVVVVAWRLSPGESEPCHTMLNLRTHAYGEEHDHRLQLLRRRQWHGGVLYPEFHYPPPPPSYVSVLNEDRLAHIAALASSRHYTCNPNSPPPTYRSHLHPPHRPRLTRSWSHPPSYRSAEDKDSTASYADSRRASELVIQTREILGPGTVIEVCDDEEGSETMASRFEINNRPVSLPSSDDLHTASVFTLSNFALNSSIQARTDQDLNAHKVVKNNDAVHHDGNCVDDIDHQRLEEMRVIENLDRILDESLVSVISTEDCESQLDLPVQGNTL